MSKADVEVVKLIALLGGSEIIFEEEDYVLMVRGLLMSNKADIDTAWEALKYAKLETEFIRR